MTEEVLSYIGGLTVLWFLYGALQLLVGLVHSCDFWSALTPALPNDGFRDKVVWITGASSGLGREMALVLAERGGAKLILSARSKEGLERVAEECQERNPMVDIKILPLDLAWNSERLVDLAQQALGHFGRIDVLVNNGGVSTRVLAREAASGVDEYLCQVDYLAQVALTKAVLPNMEALDEARIINIGSVAGKIGVPVRTAYCGAKHALLGYMSALRTETVLTGHSHIHILNIILGSTSTSLTTRAVVGMSKEEVTPEVFSGTDPNIEGGMNAGIVAGRILAISYRKSTTEAWIAPGKEYLILVLNQYMPKTALIILTHSAGQQYVVKSADADNERVKCE
jgi:short-subunit dehydrogenase